MSWLVIDANSHELVYGPHEEEPSAVDGTYPTVVMLGWPDRFVWSASARGFVPVATADPLTRLAFQRRFTQAERIAIRAATDPIVIDFRELSSLAETIDLADPDVMMGTRYLELIGLIEPGRAAEILADAPAA